MNSIQKFVKNFTDNPDYFLEDVNTFFPDINQEHFKMFVMRILGRKWREIAEEFGCSHQHAHQSANKIKEELRVRFGVKK